MSTAHSAMQSEWRDSERVSDSKLDGENLIVLRRVGDEYRNLSLKVTISGNIERFGKSNQKIEKEIQIFTKTNNTKKILINNDEKVFNFSIPFKIL